MMFDTRSAVDAYIEHCQRRGLADQHIIQKRSHLTGFLDYCDDRGVGPLSDRALLGSMDALRRQGKSARTCNFHRQIVRAFGTWLDRHADLDGNPWEHCERFDERGDRRYERRALTDEEADRLILSSLRAAGPGRAVFYALGLYAGLRKSEAKALRWRDVDLEGGVLTVRAGKSGRVDTLPIAPPLGALLRELLEPARADGDGLGRRRVVAVPTDAERRADFEAADIAIEDDRGFIADYHALRRTLHMRLVRGGVPPQIAQRIMRHSDYRTTLQHYTDHLQTEAAAVFARIFANPAPTAEPAGDIAEWLEACPFRITADQRALVEALLNHPHGRDDDADEGPARLRA